MEYYVFWMDIHGENEGMTDEPFESREDAERCIEDMKYEDMANGEVGQWVYRVEAREAKDKDEDEKERELECGDYPDSRSVVCAGGRVRRFASGYEREMWEIGMRESDFC